MFAKDSMVSKRTMKSKSKSSLAMGLMSKKTSQKTETAKQPSLFTLLVDSGLVDVDELTRISQNLPSGESLGHALVNSGIITEKQYMDVLSTELGLRFVSLLDESFSDNALNYIKQDFAQLHKIIPINETDSHLIVAMNDPMNYTAINRLELASNKIVEPVLATMDDILWALNKHYVKKTAASRMVAGAPSKMDNTAVDLLNQILMTGVQYRASDIHIDPERETIAIKYRIDGQLRDDQIVPKHLHESLVARVKILSSLDITQTRTPQDGRFRQMLGGAEVDMRVSCLPTVTGEKIVIRILDTSAALRRIPDLGFSKKNQEAYTSLLKRPSGLILITGPTGSGKTSTLYASLQEVNKKDVNVMSIEDPVELDIAGISQVQVNADVGMTFGAGLRSILRQDPNVIMVGEIRDVETATIAIRAAMTGHLVLSTLHTNSAIEAIPRLVDMGVDPYLVGSAVKGVVAQRLVQRVCKDCGKKRRPTEAEKEAFRQRGKTIDAVLEPKGCPSCYGRGYKGRLAIHEVMTMDKTVEHMLIRDGSSADLHTYMSEKGMQFLIDDGMLKIKQGLTTLDKVMGVALDD